MTIGERIKEVRKSNCLTLEKFGEKIKIRAASVSLIEKGKNNPSDQTISLICREFHVNEEWLRTGEGEMSARSYEDALEAMCAERGLSHVDYVAIRNIMEMPQAVREAVTAYMLKFAADIAAEPAAPVMTPREEVTAEVGDDFPEDIDAEVEAYRQELLEEKRMREALARDAAKNPISVSANSGEKSA